MLEAEDAKAAAVATAPRVTIKEVEAAVVSTSFITHPAEAPVLTICILGLRNGFTATGESACASPANYNRELGEEIAKKRAMEKVWMLEGYLLRERLFVG